MISAFVSRDYGFGFDISDEQLFSINSLRSGKEYIDKTAAINKNGNTMKEKLHCSPFVRKLNYGANNEGYWSYDDMILQVEDCIDTLNTINGEKYEYLFIFDHSNGHDRVSPDALSVSAISKGFGGSQPRMRPYIIKDASYLGPFDHPMRLKVGDTQSMIFDDINSGPFWLDEKATEERKYDVNKGTKMIYSKKDEMIDQLKAIGIANPKGCKSKIQQLCKRNNIPIKTSINNITEGWFNKPKGAFQMLFERGWINPSIPYKSYTFRDYLDC